jgi:hypothetical protein
MLLINESFIAILILVLAVVSVGIYLIYQQMEEELAKRQRRITQLAEVLQFAETRTGNPFYTSVLPDAYSFENPNLVYTRIRQKLNSMPVTERHAPSSTYIHTD